MATAALNSLKSEYTIKYFYWLMSGICGAVCATKELDSS